MNTVSRLLALPAVLAGRFLMGGRRRGLLAVLQTPLFFGLIVTVEDWYLFDYAMFALGNALQFDMQISGAVLYALSLALPEKAALRREAIRIKRTPVRLPRQL